MFVDFGHSPDAFEKTLAAVRRVTPGRVLMLFGADGDRDASKRYDMARTAVEGSDILVVTDHHPRFEDPDSIRATLIEGARAARPDAEIHEYSPPEARSWPPSAWSATATRSCGQGPGHQDYRDIRGVRTPYSARELARRALHAARVARAGLALARPVPRRGLRILGCPTARSAVRATRLVRLIRVIRVIGRRDQPCGDQLVGRAARPGLGLGERLDREGIRRLVRVDDPGDRVDDAEERQPPLVERVDGLLVRRVVDRGEGGARHDRPPWRERPREKPRRRAARTSRTSRVVQSSGRPTPPTRFGQSRPSEIGRRMSGGDAWAMVEPSMNSTMECTIDCGCTTTSMSS